MATKSDEDRAGLILDAAAALISHYGYAKTTVGEIAERAGISKGAVYLEFEGKEELFVALLVRESRSVMDDTMRRVEGDPEGGKISAIYRHGIMALAANPLMRALYTRDSRILGDYARRQPGKRYAERFLFGQTFVERLQEAGLLREELRPEVAAYLMGIISYGLMSIETIIPAEEAPPMEEVTEELAELVERGFGREAGGDVAAGKRALAEYFEEVERQQYQAYGASHRYSGEGGGDRREQQRDDPAPPERREEKEEQRDIKEMD